VNDELRRQIRDNMEGKETAELIEIWRTNDRVEWSDMTFEVLKDILHQRTGDIPEQDEPVLDYAEHEALLDDGLEEWETRLLDNEDQPDFYDTLEVLTLKDNIDKTARAVIIVNLVLGVLSFRFVQDALTGMFPSLDVLPRILIGLATSLLGIGLQIAIVYFPLKALAHILRILMEMEFNSRKIA
jgi:hypothetical protein